MANEPSVADVSERASPVSWPVAVTVTPGSAASDSSVTRPRTSPVVVPVACARSDAAQRERTRAPIKLRTFMQPPARSKNPLKVAHRLTGREVTAEPGTNIRAHAKAFRRRRSSRGHRLARRPSVRRGIAGSRDPLRPDARLCRPDGGVGVGADHGAGTGASALLAGGPTLGESDLSRGRRDGQARPDRLLHSSAS